MAGICVNWRGPGVSLPPFKIKVSPQLVKREVSRPDSYASDYSFIQKIFKCEFNWSMMINLTSIKALSYT